jgi:hypothetical protein
MAAVMPPAPMTWLSLIGASAAAYGVLLEVAQSREGLAGVAHDAAGAGHGVDPRPGGGGDPGQMADQVEEGALGAEQPGEGCGDGGDDGTGPDDGAVGGDELHLVGRESGGVEDGEDDGQPGDHTS